MTRVRLAWLIVLAGLAACGSSPPVDFYTLQPITGSSGVDPSGAKVVGLGPFTLPGYLDRPQLVTQLPGSEVNVDEFNRWAAPLDLAIPRVLTANVDLLLEDAVVVTFPYRSRMQSDIRVLGRIVQFDSDENGEAVLFVQWTIQDAEGETLLTPRRSRHTARASPADDPAAIVMALNETVEAFSREIADELRAYL